MRFAAMILTALCVFASTGCSDSSGPPLPPESEAVDAPSEGDSQPESEAPVNTQDDPQPSDDAPDPDEGEPEDDVTFVPEEDEPAEEERPNAPTDSRVVSVATIVARTFTAGDEVSVRCAATDADGEEVQDSNLEFAARFAPSDSFERRDGALIAVTAGQGSVTCTLPLHGIVGQAASFDIRAGAPARTRATIPRRVVAAGEAFRATCEVEDAYGNPVRTQEVSLATDPSNSSIAVEGLSVRPTVAGDYTATCVVSGATDVISDTFQVTPALPARLHTTLWPSQPSYGTDDVLEVISIVSDTYGNRIHDPRLTLTTSQRTHTFGGTSFRPTVEGRQDVTVRVTGPTHDGVTLRNTDSFVVDDSAPLVNCTSPAPGSILRGTRPGDAINIVGRFRDSGGVRQLRVEGTAARLDYEQGQTRGRFTSSVTAREGLNSVLVRATDGYGQSSDHLCHFIVAPAAQAADLFLADSASLSLGPDTLDDGNRADVDSVTDVFQAILDSDLVEDAVWAHLYGEQDGKDYWKRGSDCNHVRFNAEGVEMSRNRRVSVTPVAEGLRVEMETDWFAVDARVSTRVACIRDRTHGRAQLRGLRIDMTLAVSVEAGVPRVDVAVRDGERLAAISWDRFTSNFSGIDGYVLERLLSYLEGEFAPRISREIRRTFVNDVRGRSDSLVSSFGGSDEEDAELAASFTVPRPDGERFEIHTQVTTTTGRADRRGLALGLGTRFQAADPVRESASGLVPVVAAAPAGPGQNIRASVHPGLPTQILHALWTAGYFEGEFNNASGSISATTALPPVVSVPASGRLRVSIGGVEARATLNGYGEVVRVVGDVSVEASVRRTADGGLVLVRPEVDIRIVAPDEQIPRTQIDRASRLLELYLSGSIANALAHAPVAPAPGLTLPEETGYSRAYIQVDGVEIAPGRAIALDGRFVVE